jgi:hypothetical protein
MVSQDGDSNPKMHISRHDLGFAAHNVCTRRYQVVLTVDIMANYFLAEGALA